MIVRTCCQSDIIGIYINIMMTEVITLEGFLAKLN